MGYLLALKADELSLQSLVARRLSRLIQGLTSNGDSGLSLDQIIILLSYIFGCLSIPDL